MIRKTAVLLLLCFCFVLRATAQAPTANFTATLVSGCSPLVVGFTDQSTGSPTAWFWDFGNGATSTLKNPSTTYFIPGTYPVSLTVTNSLGAHTVTKAGYITVYGRPVVAFKGSDSIGCFPFPVQFTDQTIASPGTTNTTWFWDFGDGSQAITQNPQNTYGNTGNYTVSLKVTNDKGCWSVVNKPAYIRIDGGVKASFTFVQPISCHTPFVINFINASTGPGLLSYTWDFGDGSSAATPAPVHTYTTPGLYTVQLVTVSSNGCRDTIRKLNVLNLVNTNTSFTAPDSICVNEAATFLNTSSSQASLTTWTFGDGTASNQLSPVKAFAAPGTYNVKLVQGYGICADSVQKPITVLPRPKAVFTADKTTSCQTPHTVTFTNASTGGGSYQWSFGDGSASAQQSPVHTYTGYGSYDVTLIVTNASGCTDTLRKPGYIQVAKPVITFSSLPQRGCIPYGVNFTANVSSTDPVTSYAWDFGNGVTSTSAAPSYTYTTQGSYTVTLTITTAGNCTETYTLPGAVTVGRKPQVAFSAVPNPVCAFQTVSFTNLSNEGTSWLWQFGDGGTSNEQNPLHQYSDTGHMNVQLIVTNSGCVDSFKIPNYIYVKPPIANWRYQTSCNNKKHFVFTDASLGATTWYWTFGDGTTSTQPSPVHDYAAYGTYTVTLVVTNDTCEHQKTQVIKIVNGTPDFVALPNTACKGAPIQFVADTTNTANIVSYQWNFGQGLGGSGSTASTVYHQSGYYSPSLTITDINGCIDSTVKPNYIRINGPLAAFIAQNNNGCKGLTTTFIDQSQSDGISAIANWDWNLGDGTAIENFSAASVQHVYNTAGSYNILLKVTDAGGCSDSMLLPSGVNTSVIDAGFVSADTVTCPGAAVTFTNTSTALTAYNSQWTFGNGTTSAQQSPTMNYTADGVYTVKLKIADLYGCSDSITRLNYVSVKHPVARFTVSDSVSSCTPFQVHFTNASEYYKTWWWNLGGGNSSILSPTQYYNQAGVFVTQLVVTSPGGCTDTAVKTITVNDMSASRIKYLPLSGCKPLTVDLHAFSPANMSYTWDFGDGTILNGTDTSSVHVYNFFGDFVPKVIMRDASGCIVPVTGTDTIRIQGATTKFAVDRSTLCDSGTVRFLDSTTFNNPIIAYNWNFGDGTTSTSSVATHYYNAPGVYNVSLNVQTRNNCVDTFKLSYPVKVVQSPWVRIEGDSVVCIGDGMAHLGEFNRTDTGTVRWDWKFPNGKTANVRLPQRQLYTSAGRFVVQSIATNSSGCTDTAWKNIKVNPLPAVTLPAVITTRTGNPVLLPAIYTGGVVSYNWSPGETLNCLTCAQPTASPKFNTTYKVAFTDTNGCRNTGQVQVVVFCNNDNIFVPNTFSPNGDGANDVFMVRGKGLNRVKSLRIFNRWGQVVFERMNFAVNDAAAGWNGTFNGAKPIADVYVYQVEIFCDNSNVVKFDGNVALIQ